MNILGIHHGHDSSSCIIIDGKIIAASVEERFSRVKNDASFPINSIRYCLNEANLDSKDIDIIAIPDLFLYRSHTSLLNLSEINKISLKKRFFRKLKNYVSDYFGISQFPEGDQLPLYIKRLDFPKNTSIHFCEHHKAHAAATYYTSGFNKNKVLIITMDGIGGGISSAIWLGESSRISPIKKYGPSSSIGIFYSNATEAMGWRVNSDEWKLMGLAPYGLPDKIDLSQFHPHFKNGLLVKQNNPDFYSKGSVWRDGRSFHVHNNGATAIKDFLSKHDIKREDFAAQVQKISEQEVLNFIIPNLEKFNAEKLACGGGCFMNIKLNGLLRDNENVKDFWVYPDAGDAGLSIGAAYNAYYESINANESKKIFRLNHLYYGPGFSNKEIHNTLVEKGINFSMHDNICQKTAELLHKNLTIGWFQGKMEIGPRALGNRSILMSPIDKENKDIINAKIKYRENFRPFCPSILEEEIENWIKNPKDEKFMTSSFNVLKSQAQKIPAVVHVDGTLRPQFVSKKTNSKYHKLISEFFKLTDIPILLNTSFNIKGEPIVCNPTDAIKCFYSCGLDALVMGDFLILK